MSISDKIRTAIREKKMLNIYYDDGSKQTQRSYEPWFLFQSSNQYYVSGFCNLRNSTRILKVTRIVDCELLTDQSTKLVEVIDALNRDYIKHHDVIVDTYIPELKKELEMHNIQLKENLVIEYPKKVILPKMLKEGTIRSPLEEKIINSISDNPEVNLFEIEPFRISYEFEGKVRHYIPDVLIHYKNKKKVLIEIKVSGDISDPQNQAKFNSALKYCTDNGMEFKILGVEGRSSTSEHKFIWDENEICIETFQITHDVKAKNIKQKTKSQKSSKIEINQKCITFKCTVCDGIGVMTAKKRPNNENPNPRGYENRTCYGGGWDPYLYLASMPEELKINEEKIHDLLKNGNSIITIADKLNLQCRLKDLSQFIVTNRKIDPARWRRV